MTSGLDNVFDGSAQATALRVADLASGAAALATPTGSLVALGAVLKLLGALAVGAQVVGADGIGAPGAAAGPLCLALICAREVYWYGVEFRSTTSLAVLLFAGVAALRASAALAPGSGLAPAEDVSLLQPPPVDEEGAAVMSSLPIFQEISPVGPPVPVSFFAALNLVVLAVSKLFDPIGEDLDEEGKKNLKPSSRFLDDDLRREQATSTSSEAPPRG